MNEAPPVPDVVRDYFRQLQKHAARIRWSKYTPEQRSAAMRELRAKRMAKENGNQVQD
jgi:predicted Fe-S protein YdhL (DUF1289 family)